MARRDEYSKIRIAYLIDSITCDTAGTQKQLLETIKRLDRNVFEPCLICLWKSEWMEENDFSFPCIVLNYNGFIKLSFPGVVRRLASIIKEKKIDIIQTFFVDSIFVAMLGKIFSRRRIVALSSRRDMGLGRTNEPWYHGFLSLLLIFANHYFTGILTNSEQIKIHVAERERADLEKIKVIRNGIEVPENSSAKPGLFKKMNGVVRIGLVASLTPVKRHDVLINAIYELKKIGLHHKCRVILLGEGPEFDRLERLVLKFNLQEIISFEGAVKDVTSYLYNLDIGVLCSDREGLSNAIMEYMACGLPVIASSVGGNIELVDETNGICFPPGDQFALAASLKRLIEDEPLRKSLGESSLRKIIKSYSWGKTMVELENYYKAIVGGRF